MHANQKISLFNAHALGGQELKVSMAKEKEEHIATRSIAEP
jgi:hypothetical protein